MCFLAVIAYFNQGQFPTPSGKALPRDELITLSEP